MAIISHLPGELLDIIFGYLGSIDDVHHLSRTCKSTYQVIQSQSNYIKIMRTVIGNAPEHRFEISLSAMLDLHRMVVRHFKDGKGPFVATQPGAVFHDIETGLVSAVTFECPQGPCTECLPDDRVHEILARYQGLRVLEDEWLARELTNNDLLPIASYSQQIDFLERYDILLANEGAFRYDEAPARLGVCSETSTYTCFDSDERRRFHAAVTSLWLLNEIRWVMTHFERQPQHFGLQLRILDRCKASIESRTETPLLDDLDRYAIFRFLYHHMLPLHAAFFADRPVSFLPLTFPSVSSPSQAIELQFFLATAQVHLQPPDLIDLLIRSRISRKRPYPTLPTPLSTMTHTRPYAAANFPHNTSGYSEQYNALFSAAAQRILNLMARASLDQSEQRPQPPTVLLWNATELFSLKDSTADYLEGRVLKQIFGREERLGDWQDGWNEVWWQVWWWAGSEEKARAKIARILRKDERR